MAGISQQRQTEPKRLQSLRRGELDWIVMKALEKDRTRRYETPRSLADDIGRFLAGEPIVAKPPSPLYRLKKTLARHKVIVGSVAGTAIVVGLLAVVIVSTQSQLNSMQPAGAGNGATSRNIASDILDRFENGVVRIQSAPSRTNRRIRQSLGSGFLVDQSGLLVTNAHVLAGVKEATVHVEEGTTAIEIEGTHLIDEERDLCIAKINAAGLAALPMTTRLPQKGEIVIALGYPESRSVLATRGVILKSKVGFNVSAMLRPEATWIVFSAPLSGDWSGGPLVDDQGQVVGMCSVLEDDQKEYFGISAQDILDAIAIAKESDWCL